MTAGLLDMFTGTPLLNAAERRAARAEGREIGALEQRCSRAVPSAVERAFASRSCVHLGVAILMKGSSREELAELHSALRTGIDSSLDHCLASIAGELRSLNWNERREAWRLFGQGFIL